MDTRKYLVILFVLTVAMILIAGCTSNNPPATTPAPVATVAHSSAAVPTAAPAVSTTPECPDKYEKGIWDYSWDTRWNSYENGDTIIDLASGKDEWSGASGATAVKMSQKCWDVTGTIAFTTDPVCTGSITATIDKNHPNLLTGGWKTTGCQPEDEGAVGTVSLSMAADNKTWIGKLISVNDPYKDRDYQDNWAAKRV
jgi:hypothetical protein